MTILRYEPLNLLNQLHSSLNDLLDNRSTDNSRIATGQWTPAVDIKEEPNQFIIHADIPGMKKENIELAMEENVLTIKGQRETESKIDEKNYYRIERVSGTFYRRFSLPETADGDNIKAEYKNGVLTVTIPKKEKAQPKKITVKGD